MSSALSEVRTRNNPVGGWLMTVVSCLFAIMFFTIAAVGFAIYAVAKS